MWPYFWVDVAHFGLVFLSRILFFFPPQSMQVSLGGGPKQNLEYSVSNSYVQLLTGPRGDQALRVVYLCFCFCFFTKAPHLKKKLPLFLFPWIYWSSVVTFCPHSWKLLHQKKKKKEKKRRENNTWLFFIFFSHSGSIRQAWINDSSPQSAMLSHAHIYT